MVYSLWDEALAVVFDGWSGGSTVVELVLGEMTVWLWNELMPEGLLMRCFLRP